MGQIRWYKRDPVAWLHGTRMLSLAERGAYADLIELIMSHDGNLVDDDRFIAGWLGCHGHTWLAIKKHLIAVGKISVEDGRIVNERCARELHESLTILAKRADSGRQGGLKSGEVRRKNKDLDEAYGQANCQARQRLPGRAQNGLKSCSKSSETSLISCSKSPENEAIFGKNNDLGEEKREAKSNQLTTTTTNTIRSKLSVGGVHTLAENASGSCVPQPADSGVAEPVSSIFNFSGKQEEEAIDQHPAVQAVNGRTVEFDPSVLVNGITQSMPTIRRNGNGQVISSARMPRKPSFQISRSEYERMLERDRDG